ncbi:hypothetical protein [Chitinophaga sp. CF418]|uniref:hypothetical protein n=1 Tax=Chitinophaga sp. CF418 TaxID=1855287 RepID=UPI0009227D6A|nr:hypothetical protein [Chitinophaga sp. CF418]SHN23578.1 hypothetical protein SAMN05216311_107181 [Chitinophaga sp. CF418]
MTSVIEMMIVEGIPAENRKQEMVTITPEQVGKSIEAIVAERIRSCDKPLISFIVKTCNEEDIVEETIIRVIDKEAYSRHYWI